LRQKGGIFVPNSDHYQDIVKAGGAERCRKVVPSVTRPRSPSADEASATKHVASKWTGGEIGQTSATRTRRATIVGYFGTPRFAPGAVASPTKLRLHWSSQGGRARKAVGRFVKKSEREFEKDVGYYIRVTGRHGFTFGLRR